VSNSCIIQGNAFGIQPRELVSPFVYRIFLGATTTISFEEAGLKDVVKRFSMPTNLERVAELFGALCPSAQTLLREHTSFRLYRLTLRSGEARLMEQQYLEGSRRNTAAPLLLQRFTDTAHMHPGVCPECLALQLSDTGVGFGTWDRACALRGYDCCASHGCPVLRQCETCGEPYDLGSFKGLPGLYCRCGGRMVPCTAADTGDFALGMARDIAAILNGALDDVTGEDVLDAFQSADQKVSPRAVDHVEELLDMMQKAGASKYYAHHFAPRRGKKTLARVLAGDALSAWPMLNVFAMRLAFGSAMDLRQVVMARRVSGHDGSTCAARVTGATAGQGAAVRALFAETVLATPTSRMMHLVDEVMDVLRGELAENVDWVRALLAQAEAAKGAQRKAAQDSACAKAFECRAKLFQQDPFAPRITAYSLKEGILAYTFPVNTLPRTAAVVKQYEEDTRAYLRRKLLALANTFPECVNESMATFLREKIHTATHSGIAYREKQLRDRMLALAQRARKGRQVHGDDAAWAEQVESQANAMAADAEAPQITASVLVGGAFCKSRRLRFPLTAKVLDRVVESIEAHVRRQLRCLARDYTDILDPATLEYVGRMDQARHASLQAQLTKVRTQIRRYQRTGATS